MGSVSPWTASVAADVCVVGAGPAGLTLTRELAARGVSVCLVEAGGREVDRDVQRQSRGESDGYPIHRLHTSRVRALGGTLRHHRVDRNGWMARPMDPIDFERRDGLPNSGWPFDRRHLDPYYARAAKHCRIPVHEDDLDAFEETLGADTWAALGDDVEPTVFQRPPSGRLDDGVESALPAHVQVMLGWRVVDLTTTPGGRRVDAVQAVRDDGQRVAVRAATVVLATGGIENARLLLLADGGRGLGNRHDLVGRYFSERMLFTAGHLVVDPASRFDADRFGPTGTVSGALRVVDDVQHELGLHNCTLHLTSRADFMASASAQSISTLRKALGRRPVLPHLASHAWNSVTAVGQLPGLARRAVGRGRRALVVSHMGEQAPNPASRVRLGSRRDDLGMPVARVTWQLTDADRQAAERSVRVLGDALRAGGAGELRWTAQLESTTLVTGAHHHLGTTRMHADPRHGVVDGDGRVHDLDNLYVAGSSVFPTYGSSNPTLTIIALAIRLADHLGETLGRPPTSSDALTRPWVWTTGRGRRSGEPPAPGPDRRPAAR